MLVAQRFEEVLVNDISARRHHRIDHVVPDQVDENLLQPCTDQRTGKAQDDPALFIAQHALINRSCPGKVTGAVRHVLHRIHKRDHIMLLDINMLNRLLQKVFFRSHRYIQNIKQILLFTPALHENKANFLR